MDLLYCDETNLEARSGDFFVYGGILVLGEAARPLSECIDQIRTKWGIDPRFPLKFNPKPEHLSQQEFNAVKEAMIRAAADHDVGLIVSVILHDIATSPDEARRNEINRVCYHYDRILNRSRTIGIVLIDRFSDKQIDFHLAEKFSVGLTGLPYSPTYRLSNVLGFHYSAIGQSHFTSLIDIILGSLRFAINAFSRNDEGRLPTARKLLGLIAPLPFKEKDREEVSELGFSFSPKIVKVDKYLRQYGMLKEFLAENGIVTEQKISNERTY